MKNIKKVCFIAVMMLMTASLLTACGNDKKDGGAALKNDITTPSLGNGIDTKKETDKAAALKPADASDFEYEEEDGKIVLTSYVGSSKEIVIPATIGERMLLPLADSVLPIKAALRGWCALIHCWKSGRRRFSTVSPYPMSL